MVKRTWSFQKRQSKKRFVVFFSVFWFFKTWNKNCIEQVCDLVMWFSFTNISQSEEKCFPNNNVLFMFVLFDFENVLSLSLLFLLFCVFLHVSVLYPLISNPPNLNRYTSEVKTNLLKSLWYQRKEKERIIK